MSPARSPRARSTTSRSRLRPERADLPMSSFESPMNRRTFLQTWGAPPWAAPLGKGGFPAQPPPPAAAPKPPPPPADGVTPPVLQNVGPDRATVFWSAAGAAHGWVEFGETEALGQVARGES